MKTGRWRSAPWAWCAAPPAISGNTPPGRDFHVIRTGGVASARDLRAALDVGASLCQWYSGYFEAFGRAGHGLYRALYRELAEKPPCSRRRP